MNKHNQTHFKSQACILFEDQQGTQGFLYLGMDVRKQGKSCHLLLILLSMMKQ